MKSAGTTCWLALLFSVGCAASPEPLQRAEPIQKEGFVQLTEPDNSRTIWDGVFTVEQATRGRRAATENCIVCHSPGDWSAPTFLDGWAGGRRLGDLYVKMQRTMPQNDPGRLASEAYADIIAYMLQLHNAPAGEAELPSDLETLDRIIVTSVSDSF